MLSKILLGVILSFGLTGYLYYQFTIVPMQVKLEEQSRLIQAFELREATQKETIEKLQTSFETQTTALNDLSAKNSEINGEMNRYLDIFKRHNLSKLAAAKPGLIEKRINHGTKAVFDSIENDSAIIDSINK
tara:strand:- start:51 stop:446 length:396 start_codon:yes stop_codon:yes gene_type:complete